MPAALIRLALLGGAALAAVPAFAVGLGPLSKEGSVFGDRKAFYLTVLNPEAGTEIFSASAIGYVDEQPVPRVTVFPSRMQLGGGQMRQILVIASDLKPGETYQFRVCAERAEDPEGTTIHARVCSKLTARRIAPALVPATALVSGN